MSMNSFAVGGRLGDDPKLEATKSGVPCCTIKVAEGHKRGQEEWTIWYSCTAYHALAERVCRFFKKGQPIYVNGKILKSRAYQRKNGELAAEIEVEMFGFQFVPFGSKPGEGAGRTPAEPEDEGAPDAEMGGGEMPDIADPFADQ